MKKIIATLVASFLFSTLLFSQGTKEDITISFFNTYKTDPFKAYEQLFLGNKWMADKKSVLETNKIKLKDLLDQLGDYNGYEFITEKQAGPSYILKSFIAKYDRQPVRYTFILYKPKDTWVLQNFTYDVNIDSELEEAGKIDRLKANWQ